MLTCDIFEQLSLYDYQEITRTFNKNKKKIPSLNKRFYIDKKMNMLDKTNKEVDQVVRREARGEGILKEPSRGSLPKQPRSLVPQKAPEVIKDLYRKYDPFLNGRERFLRSAFRDRDSIYDVYKRFYEYEYRARKGEEIMIQLYSVDLPDQGHHLNKLGDLFSTERTLFDKFEAKFKQRGWNEMENLKDIDRSQLQQELEDILNEFKINPDMYKEVLDASALVDQKSMLGDNIYNTKRQKLTSLQGAHRNMISRKKVDPQENTQNDASDLRREIDGEIEKEIVQNEIERAKTDRSELERNREGGMRIEDVGREGEIGEIEKIKNENENDDDDYEYNIKNLILGTAPRFLLYGDWECRCFIIQSVYTNICTKESFKIIHPIFKQYFISLQHTHF